MNNQEENGPARDATPGVDQQEDRPEAPENTWQHMPGDEKRLERKKKKYSQLKRELLAYKGQAERSERINQRRRKAKSLQREVLRLRLRSAGHTAKERVEGESGTGALPDFIIIGAAKGGTTFFYNLLVKHPHIEPAAHKEPHFFDHLFDEGIEVYRRCFPLPQWIDGRKTITGEATPGYLFHPEAAERMAAVVPQARLIALLRNPVDLIYSSYQHRVRKGQEPRAFEETARAALDDPHHVRLTRGIYVDHLLHWSRFFSTEQMLVLKSEDLFEHAQETLERTLNFLDLPDWQPEGSALQDRRNKGNYEQEMDPTTRRRLEEYFEPHNRRLYEYLGVDFGW